jgi:hypothetical protein
MVDCDSNDKNIVGLPKAEYIHIFHSDCILEWLEQKPTCPSCRATYIPKTKAVTDIEEETNGASKDKA